MSERDELESLRRMAELEAKAGGSSLPKAASKMPASVDWAMELEKQKASEMSPLSRFAMSVGQPMADIERTGRRVLSNAGIGNYGAEDARRDKQLESPYINQAGRMTGDVLLNMSMPTPDKGGVLRRTLMNLGQGAGYGAATTPEDTESGAAGGAFGSAVGMGANRLLGGLIKPFISQDAKELAKQGIQPTIGQGIGGFVNTAEQKLKSLPLIGDVLRGSRERAVNEFNEKAIQTAVPGSKGFGDEALTTARKSLGNQYDSVLDKLPNIQVDKSSILQALRGAVNDPALALNNESKKFVKNYVKDNLINRTGQLNGQTAKKIESDFAAAIARKATGNAEDRATADAMRNVQQQWRQSLTQAADAVNPGSGAALREADASWRAFIPLDRAGGYRGNQNAAANEVTGRFTPNSLRRSMEASDQSQFNNATRSMSGGNSPFEKLNTLTRQGERVLGDSVPDSGTATRLGWGMMGLGAVGAGTGAVDPSTMLGGAALALPFYTRTGSKFAMQGVEPLYQAAVKQLSLRGVPTQVLDEALRKYGPEGVISLARSAGVSSQQ
jgi:hypothetical protein